MDYKEIKKVSLEHSTNILLKNKIRELREKEKAHELIMGKDLLGLLYLRFNNISKSDIKSAVKR